METKLQKELREVKAELAEAKKLLLSSAQVGMSHDDTAIESVAATCMAFLKEPEEPVHVEEKRKPVETEVQRLARERGEVEKRVLGNILVNNSYLSNVRQRLDAGDFSSEINRRIFNVMIELSNKGEEITPESVLIDIDYVAGAKLLASGNYDELSADMATIKLSLKDRPKERLIGAAKKRGKKIATAVSESLKRS